MAYPYEHKSTYNPSGETMLYKFEEAASVGNSTHLFDVNLPYGAYSIGMNVWYDGVTAAKTLRVVAYIDHAQTVVSSAFRISTPGATGTTTTVTNASTAGINGQVVRLFGDFLGISDIVVAAHGLRVSVVAATNIGTIEVEVVAARRS